MAFRFWSNLATARRCGVVIVIVALAALAAGCSRNSNPILGKWSIAQREKELDTSFVDELIQNSKSSTGATTLEFRPDSILITGSAPEHLETGVKYYVTPLEGGAFDVRIMQKQGGDPDNNDVDLCHIEPDGKTARLESRNAVYRLSRLAD
jgi:hypothetical protein